MASFSAVVDDRSTYGTSRSFGMMRSELIYVERGPEAVDNYTATSGHLGTTRGHLSDNLVAQRPSGRSATRRSSRNGCEATRC